MRDIRKIRISLIYFDINLCKIALTRIYFVLKLFYPNTFLKFEFATHSFLEVIMYHFKMVIYLVSFYFIAPCLPAYATVYDFGDLNHPKREFTKSGISQINNGYSYGNIMYAQNGHNEVSAIETHGDHNTIGKYLSSDNNVITFAIEPEIKKPFKHLVQSSTDSGKLSNQLSTSSLVPEPETYLLILTGLALIGYTARHRYQD